MNREDLLKLDKEELVDIILAQQSQIELLLNQVQLLTARVAELEARLNMNSSNSSKASFK